MKKIKFELQIYCTVGFDDNEDVATLEVGTFSEAIEFTQALEKNAKRHEPKDSKARQLIEEYKEMIESKSGEEIMILGEVIGLKCLYEDDKGIKAEMLLSDESGVSGQVKVSTEEHNNEYKRLLAEAKKIATQIVKL